jgi:hypothetical protein
VLQCRSKTQRDWSPEDSTSNDENARNCIAIAIQSIDDTDDADDADLHESGRCFSYQCGGGIFVRPAYQLSNSLDSYALSIATNRSTPYWMLAAATWVRVMILAARPTASAMTECDLPKESRCAAQQKVFWQGWHPFSRPSPLRSSGWFFLRSARSEQRLLR